MRLNKEGYYQGMKDWGWYIKIKYCTEFRLKIQLKLKDRGVQFIHPIYYKKKSDYENSSIIRISTGCELP